MVSRAGHAYVERARMVPASTPVADACRALAEVFEGHPGDGDSAARAR